MTTNNPQAPKTVRAVHKLEVWDATNRKRNRALGGCLTTQFALHQALGSMKFGITTLYGQGFGEICFPILTKFLPIFIEFSADASADAMQYSVS